MEMIYEEYKSQESSADKVDVDELIAMYQGMAGGM